MDKEDHRYIKDAFLEKYILCEIPTKAALTYYYAQNGEQKEVESIEMAYITIKAALKKSGYAPDDDCLRKMFKANEKRGEKSNTKEEYDITLNPRLSPVILFRL